VPPGTPRAVLTWVARMVVAALVILAWLLYSGHGRPTPVLGSWSAGAPFDGTVVVMTYNINHARGIDARVDLERIVEVIRDSGAQVVSLQEVDRLLPRSGMQDQAREIARALDMDYVYAPNLGIGRVGYGNAILSSFPVADWEVVRFRGIKERRGIARVALDLGDGRTLQVFSTHLSFDPTEVRGQARQAMRFIARFPGPKVIMGDLNLEDHWPEVKLASTRYQDAGSSAGFTFPSWAPRCRIDYIFVSRSVTVLGARVIWSEASDHLPVIAHLSL